VKHVFEENSDVTMEDIMRTGEKEGIPAAGEKVKKAADTTWENVANKEQAINDKDWDRLSEELDSIFGQLSRHPEFRRAFDQMAELMSSLSPDYYTKNVPSSGTAEKLQEESKGLIAQFSGEEVLDKLFDRVQELSDSVRDDQEVQQWWKEFKDNIDKLGKNYQGKKDLDKLRDLFDKSFKLFDQYRPKINKIIDLCTEIFDNMRNDEYVRDLQQSLSTLADDLYWFDNEGNRHFDTNAANDLASAVGEVLRKQLTYMPLPRIEGIDGSARYTLDNLNICATLPEKISFHLESDAVLDITRTDQSGLKTELYLTSTIKGIKACGKNISFTYASPNLRDSGVMDVCIPSADLTVDFVFSPSTSESEPGRRVSRYQFVRVRSYFSVSDIEINYHKETLSHNILVPLLTTLFKPYIINNFETGVQKSIDETLINAGEKIRSILEQTPYSLSLSSFPSSYSSTRGKVGSPIMGRGVLGNP
jgi:uncharacterized membrane-anchored protein YhcB (DUF1043 family)